MQPIVTQAMSSVQTWSDYLFYVIEAQFPRDDPDTIGRYVVHVGGFLLVLLFWTPITAEFETMKKHTATAWTNTSVATVKVPATPPVCTERVKSIVQEPCSLAEVELIGQCPLSTSAERQRFLEAKSGNTKQAAKKLETYLEWHFAHQKVDKELPRQKVASDEDVWNRACLIAMTMRKERDIHTLPRIVRNYRVGGQDMRDKSGKRILHVMPGQIDDKLAKPATYALALALYLDRILDRTTKDKVSVLIDVRSGTGWANIAAHRQLGFIKEVAKLLLTMFPERLHQCLLYPVPPAAKWIWNIVKACIDPKTAEKFQLFAGDIRADSPAPMDDLVQFMPLEYATRLEQERIASFKPDE